MIRIIAHIFLIKFRKKKTEKNLQSTRSKTATFTFMTTSKIHRPALELETGIKKKTKNNISKGVKSIALRSI